MIQDPKIVKETRQVRCSISERFGNDPDRYIDYLLALEDQDEAGSKFSPDEDLPADISDDYRDRY